jgi:transposase
MLPYCNPHPTPNSVIVLDNASIHRSEHVRQLCKRAGVILEYLPSYSPDYNPIEKSFKQLKSWIKRPTGKQRSLTTSASSLSMQHSELAVISIAEAGLGSVVIR